MPNVKKGERVVLATTAITEFILIDAGEAGADAFVVTDPANSGTIQMMVAKTAPGVMTGQNSYPADKRAPLRVGRNQKVYLQGSAINQAAIFEY